MNWYKLAEAAELTVTPKEFQDMGWEEKQYLVKNTSISSQTQQLFFTEEYENKDDAIWYLASNPNITLETQLLFFTEEYGGKRLALSYLKFNPSFLKGLTPKEMREFTKTNKLTVYSKRFNESRLKFYRLRD